MVQERGAVILAKCRTPPRKICKGFDCQDEIVARNWNRRRQIKEKVKHPSDNSEQNKRKEHTATEEAAPQQ
jgi:hypothetical protein